MKRKSRARKQIILRALLISIMVFGGFLILTGERVELSCSWTKTYENVGCTLSKYHLLDAENTKFVLFKAQTQKQYYSVGGRDGNVYLRSYLLTALSTENGKLQLYSKSIGPEELVNKLNTLLDNRTTEELQVEIKDTQLASYSLGVIMLIGSLIWIFQAGLNNKLKRQ